MTFNLRRIAALGVLLLAVTLVPAAAFAASAPAAPQNIVVTSDETSATISWEHADDDGGTPITGYAVGWGTGGMGDGLDVAPDVLTYTFDLEPGEYMLSVAAYIADPDDPDDHEKRQYSERDFDRPWTWVGPTAERLSGENRVDTANAISQATFADGAAAAIVLTRSDNYPDALAGAALAGATYAPLLLTASNELQDSVAEEIVRALHEEGTVYILGSTSALSAEVEAEVAELGFTVERIAGADRMETAAATARVTLGEERQPAAILLAYGFNHPDALSAAAAAAAIGGVVLLTTGEGLPAATAEFIADYPDAPVYAVGGPAAADYPEATPIIGSSRTGTAVMVAETFFEDTVRVSLATGWDFPDALAGGADSGRKNSPVLLTDPNTLSGDVEAYIAANCATVGNVTAYGGQKALSGEVYAAAEAALECDG